MSGMRRPLITVAVAAALCLALAVGTVLKLRRDAEWTHGGDTLDVRAELRLADAETLPQTAVALGYPVDQPVLLPGTARQAVVVRMRWQGPAQLDGRYELIVLDQRETPPRPLPAYGGWNVEGGTGHNSAGAYEKLAERYDWLAGTAAVPDSNGGWLPILQAVDSPADETGTVTAIFLVPGDRSRFTETTGQLLVAVFYVDEHGEVRWARRVTG